MNFHPDVFYVARKIWINRNLSREQHRALRDDMSDIGPRESSLVQILVKPPAHLVFG